MRLFLSRFLLIHLLHHTQLTHQIEQVCERTMLKCSAVVCFVLQFISLVCWQIIKLIDY